ncbi:MAG TPA: hypothetical protein V6C57_01955 [Coleofasciculaceae cyanobacterium]
MRSPGVQSKNYERRIKRWVVVRMLPNLRHVDVARFYKAQSLTKPANKGEIG